MAMPERIGPYEVRGEIGAGGMGVVYQGWDPRLNRTVAIKTLRPERGGDAEARRLFVKEAQAVAAISHPNVTQIYDIGEQDGMVYFAMEFLDGMSLKALLQQEGPLSPARAVSLTRQAALGLKAAAQRGIVHRDIKPSNLVLSGSAGLKITDFGLATKIVAEPRAGKATSLFGTPDYIAPERASGGTSDARGDIYSLGATLFELLTGRPPFVGDTPVDVLRKHVRDPVPSPRSLRPDLSHPLASLVQKMMAKHPEARPQSYDQLVRQLDRLPASIRASEAAAARTLPVVATPAAEASPWGPRILIFSVLSMLGLVGVSGWMQWQGEDAGAPASLPVPVTAPAPLSAVAEPVADVPRTRPRAAPFRAAPTRPEPARKPAELTIVNKSHEITAEGELRVSGEVTNVGESRAGSGKVKVLLVDESGEVLDSAVVPLAPPVVGPGESSTFEAVLGDFSEGRSIRFELHWIS